MHVISLVSQKGGAGKSILAINLAVAAAGETVVILDLDPQGTVRDWFDIRTAEAPAVLAHDQVVDIVAALAELRRQGFTLAIIDTIGSDADAARRAMQVADLCLLPVRPSGPDMIASKTTIDALRAMGRRFAVVLNQVSTNATTRTTTVATASLAQFGAVVPTAVALRMDFGHAFVLGLGVIEYAPRSKAAEEIGSLWAWCAKQLRRDAHAQTEQGRRRDERAASTEASPGGAAGKGTEAAKDVHQVHRLHKPGRQKTDRRDRVRASGQAKRRVS
jgi:chromosome partitioning protein